MSIIMMRDLLIIINLPAVLYQTELKVSFCFLTNKTKELPQSSFSCYSFLSTFELERAALRRLVSSFLPRLMLFNQVEKDICIHRVVIKAQLYNTELEYAAIP